MKKAHQITTYGNPLLCISFILCNLLGLPVWLQLALSILWLINFIVLMYSTYATSFFVRKKEEDIAGEAIAAFEAGDYAYTMHILQKYKNQTRLGDAFQFYVLGILCERTKKSDQHVIESLDRMRDMLFNSKLLKK